MIKTPVQKIEQAVREYLDTNKSPFISPTVLHTILELSETLRTEEKVMFERCFLMGATVKPNVDPLKACDVFMNNNFGNPQVRKPSFKKEKA